MQHAGAVDYEPLNLAAYANAKADLLTGQAAVPVGRHAFHGLPFVIGDPDDATRPSLISVEATAEPVRVPVGRLAHGVLIAHRLADPTPDGGGRPGQAVATYRVELEDGSVFDCPIRRRFEIEAAPADYWDFDEPFRAQLSTSAVRAPRYAGKWAERGQRQFESHVEVPPPYLLWWWKNPRPESPIASIRLSSHGQTVAVAAITLSHVDESPFVRTGPSVVLVGTADGGSVSGLEAEVDRGTASYLRPLPPVSVEAFLDDSLPGWGLPLAGDPIRAYTHVAAIPSATLSITRDGAEVAAVGWKDLVSAGTARLANLELTVEHPQLTWVRVTVVDEETGVPIACRVSFRDRHGVPYQPHGHPAEAAFEDETWSTDIGGDVRLGGLTYAAVPGTCEGWLPVGEVLVDVARGFEYQPYRTRIRVEAGQRELRIVLKRWISMAGAGWYSGDSHVHFLSAQASLVEQMAEDVHVVNVLATQWAHLFTQAAEFSGSPVASPDGRYVTYVSQENRQPMLGHLALWGLREPVLPWCSDGLSEGDAHAPLDTTLSDWADRCHAQSGTVIVAHVPRPDGETAALVATGRVDGIEMILHHPEAHRAYYNFLNAGYRIPLVAGTDKMSADVPVGLYRTYAHLGDEEFSFEAWCRAVREGRTFVTSGPMLGLTVDDATVGDTVSVPPGQRLTVTAWAEGNLPVSSLELLRNGAVVARTLARPGDRRIELTTEVTVDDDSWFAVRAGGPEYFDVARHRDVWTRGIFAHSSPVYVSVGDQWRRFERALVEEMLTLVRGGIEYVDETAIRSHAGPAHHHHGEHDHRAFLLRPFKEAEHALAERLARGA